jgi:hypothetical protein
MKPSESVSRSSDSASVPAVTRVSAEQSSKRTMRRPTRQRGRDHCAGHRCRGHERPHTFAGRSGDNLHGPHARRDHCGPAPAIMSLLRARQRQRIICRRAQTRDAAASYSRDASHPDTGRSVSRHFSMLSEIILTDDNADWIKCAYRAVSRCRRSPSDCR